MEKLIQSIELMIMAAKELEQVDYVYDTLKKYKKLNPFIAKSNTLLADKENVIRFDGYATEALELFYSLSEKELQVNKSQRILCSILLEAYKKENKALECRFDIYDSSLLESAKEIRVKHLNLLGKYYEENEKEQMQSIMPLLEERVELKREKIRCKHKIESNQEIYKSYSRKILFKRNAQETARTAIKYIEIQQIKLEDMEKCEEVLDTKLHFVLREQKDTL